MFIGYPRRRDSLHLMAHFSDATDPQGKWRLSAEECAKAIGMSAAFPAEVARIEGGELIPMGSIPQALQSLDAEENPLIVYCHHGVRSLHVVSWLRQQGVENCVSMTGGIDRWSLEVDPAVPRY